MLILRLLKILRVALRFGLDEFLFGHERVRLLRLLTGRLLFWRDLSAPRASRLRQALEAGLKTKRLQSQIAILKERRDLMRAFSESAHSEQSEVLAQMEKSLAELKTAYTALVADIRRTHEDYQRQLFGNAVSLSMQASTENFYRSLAKAGIAGLGVGLAFGLGLSLLGLGLGRRPAS